MSNIKISQLPNWIGGNTTGSFIVMNDSGSSTTYKIRKEDWLFPYSGNATISGSLNVTGSLTVTGSNLTVFGASQNSLIANGNLIQANTEQNLLIGRYNTISSSFAYTRIVGPVLTVTGSMEASGSAHKIVGNTTITGSLIASSSAAGVTNRMLANRTNGGNTIVSATNIIQAHSSVQGNYITALDGASNAIVVNNTGSNILEIQGTGKNILIGTTEITGSLTVSGSIIQTGSVQGNVFPLSISSNTASLNLNNGNFFTLQLVSGSATHLNPSNIKPGQTVSIFVNTTGSATMTFPSSIKQISGSPYVPTTSTGLDILTLVSRDSSNLYLVNAKNFI